MANITNKRLTEGTVLTTTAATMYTAPTATSTLIKKVTFANVAAVAVTVTAYLIPLGGTAGASNTILLTVSVGANSTFEAYVMENHVLATGDFVQALCSAATSVTFAMSGIEILN
jgi:hypothetical protein